VTLADRTGTRDRPGGTESGPVSCARSMSSRSWTCFRGLFSRVIFFKARISPVSWLSCMRQLSALEHLNSSFVSCDKQQELAEMAW